MHEKYTKFLNGKIQVSFDCGFVTKNKAFLTNNFRKIPEQTNGLQTASTCMEGACLLLRAELEERSLEMTAVRRGASSVPVGERCASYASEFSDLRLKKDTLSAQGIWRSRGFMAGGPIAPRRQQRTAWVNFSERDPG